MEPQIQYAKTSDGVNIAYWVIGAGPPVIFMRGFVSHLMAEWRNPMYRRQYEAIARVSTLVRFDQRGFGMSDRDPGDFSLDGMVSDVEAVVDRLALPTFNLLAFGLGTGQVGTAYAARYSNRVSRLVLFPGVGRVPAPVIEQLKTILAIGKEDWAFASEALLRHFFGWDEGDWPRPGAEVIREGVTFEPLNRFFDALMSWDVSERARELKMPTLSVGDDWDVRHMGVAALKDFAASLPNGQLVLVDAASQEERWNRIAGAITEFLSEARVREFRIGQPEDRQREPRPHSGTAVILFADIVESTALTERLGDAAFRAKARELGPALRAVIREHAGTPIEGKLLGDGVLAVFTSARQAIEAALACGRSGDEAGLPLHLGLHAGDVIREENNVYGGAVNIASRISALSASGEVLVSETVRSLARTSAGVRFEDRGEQSLKGVGEAVRVWAVRGGE